MAFLYNSRLITLPQILSYSLCQYTNKRYTCCGDFSVTWVMKFHSVKYQLKRNSMNPGMDICSDVHDAGWSFIICSFCSVSLVTKVKLLIFTDNQRSSACIWIACALLYFFTRIISSWIFRILKHFLFALFYYLIDLLMNFMSSLVLSWFSKFGLNCHWLSWTFLCLLNSSVRLSFFMCVVLNFCTVFMSGCILVFPND